MKNYKIKTSFEGPKALANKNVTNFIIWILILLKIGCNSMLYMIFKHDREPVLIQWLLTGFKAILENFLNPLKYSIVR